MVKNKGRKPATTRTVEIPDFPYDVRPTFIPVENDKVRHGKLAKGLLDSVYLRSARPSARGDVRFRMFTTRTYATHSALAHRLDMYPQPTAELNWRGTPFVLAGRYTADSGRLGPMDVTLMLDSREGEVRDQQGYDELRFILGLSMVSALFQRSGVADPRTTPLTFTISNNFRSGGALDVDRFDGNLLTVTDKLRPGA